VFHILGDWEGSEEEKQCIFKNLGKRDGRALA
jgi:hypothetical protein